MGQAPADVAQTRVATRSADAAAGVSPSDATRSTALPQGSGGAAKKSDSEVRRHSRCFTTVDEQPVGHDADCAKPAHGSRRRRSCSSSG